MALPTVPTQGLIDAALQTDQAKAWRFVQEVKKVKDICLMVGAETNPGPVTAMRLVQLQSSLFSIKSFITSNALTTLGPRTVIAQQYPGTYANAAAVQTDVQAANTAFNNLTAELEGVLATARTAGQLVDCDPSTGQRIDQTLDAAATADLRALAATVAASLG